ncbi:hypothetical protein [Sapientia aquatica]|jgi:hypothetical protein|uniref:hypothetical protein n=1 Tax=Sapientia aquatica TaxID=1549640 RepID=UPI0014049F93|nr:hypothetical protein [Sapientia aquatica]
MDTNQAVVLASYIGSKMHDEFIKIFSGDIEESELVHNQLKNPPEVMEPEPSND